jgi:hypothetical protein
MIILGSASKCVQARKPTPHATGLHCYRWATFVGRMKDNEVWSLGPDVTLSFEGVCFNLGASWRAIRYPRHCRCSSNWQPRDGPMTNPEQTSLEVKVSCSFSSLISPGPNTLHRD